MAKIDRIEAEMNKIDEKVLELQARRAELEQQHTDEENTMIIQMVRKQKMTPRELEKFLERNAASLTNPTKTPPITPGPGLRDTENNQ